MLRIAGRSKLLWTKMKKKKGYGLCRNPLIFIGAETRNRTRDTRIFSPLLYLLSYPAKRATIK